MGQQFATIQEVSLGLATKTIPYALKMADFATDEGIKMQNFRKGTPEQYQAHLFELSFLFIYSCCISWENMSIEK